MPFIIERGMKFSHATKDEEKHAAKKAEMQEADRMCEAWEKRIEMLGEQQEQALEASRGTDQARFREAPVITDSTPTHEDHDNQRPWKGVILNKEWEKYIEADGDNVSIKHNDTPKPIAKRYWELTEEQKKAVLEAMPTWSSYDHPEKGYAQYIEDNEADDVTAKPIEPAYETKTGEQWKAVALALRSMICDTFANRPIKEEDDILDPNMAMLLSKLRPHKGEDWESVGLALQSMIADTAFNRPIGPETAKRAPMAAAQLEKLRQMAFLEKIA